MLITVCLLSIDTFADNSRGKESSEERCIRIKVLASFHPLHPLQMHKELVIGQFPSNTPKSPSKTAYASRIVASQKLM